MAELIDKRMLEGEIKALEELELKEETQQQAAKPEPVEEIPDKYRNKS